VSLLQKSATIQRANGTTVYSADEALRYDIRLMIDAVKENRLYLPKDQLDGLTETLKYQVTKDVNALHKHLKKKMKEEKSYYEQWDAKKTKEVIEQMKDATRSIRDYQRLSGKAIAVLLANITLVVWIIAGVVIAGIGITAFATYAFNIIKLGDWQTLKGICILLLSLSSLGFTGWLIAKLLKNFGYWD